MNATNRKGDVLGSPLRALTQSLAQAMPAGNSAAVHHARVASRRVREALPIVASPHDGVRMERRIRRITRALGPVREIDVSLELLHQLRDSGVVSAQALAPLRRALSAERAARWNETRKQLADGGLEKLRRRASHAGDADTARTTRKDRRRLAARAQTRAIRRAVGLRFAVERAAGIYLPDCLHEVRIAVKKLRYALELLGEVSPVRGAVRLRVLRGAQDVLGRMHDVEVLIARIRTLQATPGGASLRASADLDRVVRALEIECRQLHGHYVTTRKTLLRIADAVTAMPARQGAA